MGKSASGKGVLKGTHKSTKDVELMALGNSLVHAYYNEVLFDKCHVLWQCDNQEAVNIMNTYEDLDLLGDPKRTIVLWLQANKISLTARWIKGHSKKREPRYHINRLVDDLATKARKE